MAYAGGGIHIDFVDQPSDQEFDRFEEDHSDDIEAMLDKALDAAKVVLDQELKAAGMGGKFKIETEV